MSAEGRIAEALDALVEAVDEAGFEAAADEIMARSDELDGWPDWAEALLDQVRSAVQATKAQREGRYVVRIDAPGGERISFETAGKADVDAIYAALEARLAGKSEGA